MVKISKNLTLCHKNTLFRYPVLPESTEQGKDLIRRDSFLLRGKPRLKAGNNLPLFTRFQHFVDQSVIYRRFCTHEVITLGIILDGFYILASVAGEQLV